MNTFNNQCLKIGKISPLVESAFRSAFAVDPNIYFLQKDLDALAIKYPSRYLRVVEEISHIIEDPDLICYSSKGMFYIYFRLYSASNRFRVLGVRFSLKGHPNVWTVDGMREYKDQDVAALNKNASFRRIPTKAKRGRKKKSK